MTMFVFVKLAGLFNAAYEYTFTINLTTVEDKNLKIIQNSFFGIS